jgi:hypothetical protein
MSLFFSGETEPRYTIEEAGIAFITLPTLTRRIEPVDVKWLEQELERTKELEHVFVLAHYPLLDEFDKNIQAESGGRDVLALLQK